MEKKSLYVFSFLLVSIFFLTSLAAAAPPVCDWRGYAIIDNGLTNSSSVITSYTNGSQATNGTIYSSGYYILHVPGNNGDNVTFKICGVYVNESYRTWSCGGDGYNTLNLSINTSATGVACTYSCGCASGYCVHSYCRAASTYCGDSYCDSGESCSSCTADCGSCAGAPSPGGGTTGGGAAATTTTTTTVTIVTETENVTKIQNGTSSTVNISQSDTLKIESINVEVKNTVNNVQITVKESSLPAGANVAISSDQGAVYKYLEITKVNVQDSDINKVKIKFKVEKSWLTANNIDPATVALQRLSGNSWTKLSTTKLSEDSTYIYFESESPGLSVFAITGQKKVVTTTTVAPPVTTTTTKPAPPAITGTTQLYVAILIGIFVLLALVYFVWKRPKKQQQ